LLEESRSSFDRFFFDWYGGIASEPRALAGPLGKIYRGAKWDLCRRELAERTPSAPERLADPYFQGPGPCTLVIDEVERIWSRIDAANDWSALEAKVEAIRSFGRVHGRGPELTAASPALPPGQGESPISAACRG